MVSNDVFDFFSVLPDVKNRTVEGDQLITAGISTLSDVLDTPLSQVFQTAITEHYRSCRLSYSVSSRLIELLNEKGINVTFDTEIEPDVCAVPKVFSSVAVENKEIATTFDRLLMELGHIPAIEELAYETGLSADSLRNNSDLKKLSLEHQQVLNYIEWFCSNYTCELPRTFIDLANLNSDGPNTIDWGKYPYNLFLDVVPAADQIRNTLQNDPVLLARLIQRLDSLVYFDLATEERNIITSQYIEGIICFHEPALQWGLMFRGKCKKNSVLCNLRRKFQGGRFLAENGLLGSDAILELPIEELGLSERTYNRLKYVYIDTIAKLITKTKDGLMRAGKLRQPILEEVVSKIHHFGLCLADEETM